MKYFKFININGTPHYVKDQEGRESIAGLVGMDDIPEEYDTSTSYAAGDYCLYGGAVYRCLTATSGTWNASCWEEASITILAGNVSTLLSDREDYYGRPTINGARSTSGTIIYALTTAGTSGYVLTSSGSGAPAWTAQSSLSVGKASKLGSSTVGGATTPIYLSSGSPTVCTKPASGAWFAGIPDIQSNGVTELGRYIDFHPTTDSTLDYHVRIDSGTSTTQRIFTFGSAGGEFVTHTAGTAIGGAAKPVFIASTGAATACSSTVGSDVIPVYLSSGTIIASTSTVGDAANPIYMSGGVLTPMSSTIGGAAKPVFMSSGVITPFSSTVGSADTPVYMNGGTITSTGKSFSNYLPLSGGTMTGNIYMNTSGKGYYLSDAAGNSYAGICNNELGLWIGGNRDPYSSHVGAVYISSGWASSEKTEGNEDIFLDVPRYNADDDTYSSDLYPLLHAENYTNYVTQLGTATVGTTIKPIYLKDGVPTALSNTVGGSTQPVYMSSGSILACYPNHLYNGTTKYVGVDSSMFGPTDACGDDVLALGRSSYRWKTIYASSSTISTSDANEKTEIISIDEVRERLFMSLRPVTYRWRNLRDTDSHDRIHCGLVAQEVLAACMKVGLNINEFGALCRDDLEEPTADGRTERYGLRYEEFVPLTIHMVQKNVGRIDILEAKVAAQAETIAKQNKTILQMQEKINQLEAA